MIVAIVRSNKRFDDAGRSTDKSVGTQIKYDYSSILWKNNYRGDNNFHRNDQNSNKAR